MLVDGEFMLRPRRSNYTEKMLLWGDQQAIENVANTPTDRLTTAVEKINCTGGEFVN